MKHCPVCETHMKINKMGCPGCGLAVEGGFQFPPLARLSRENSRLAEWFILSGGNLKDLAVQMEVSYPTLRKRVDGLMEALKQLRVEDEKKINTILRRIERGEMPAEEGTRLIREVQGEL